MLTQKAVRATIVLGDIELDCLQYPDGSYHFYSNQLEHQLNIRARNQTGKKYLQPLLDGNSKRVTSAKVEGSQSMLKAYSIDLATQAIAIYASLGNQKCMAVAIACMAEALERRADAAFGVKRTEEERNQRLIDRQAHREDFHPKFTAWLKSDGCEGTQYAIEVNSFKRLLGLPIASVNEYDSKQLRVLDVAYIKYDVLRTTGMSHLQAVRLA